MSDRADHDCLYYVFTFYTCCCPSPRNAREGSYVRYVAYAIVASWECCCRASWAATGSCALSAARSYVLTTCNMYGKLSAFGSSSLFCSSTLGPSPSTVRTGNSVCCILGQRIESSRKLWRKKLMIMVYNSKIQYLNNCLVQPAVPSIIWGTIFSGVDAFRGQQITARSIGKRIVETIESF
jgi:hypothetical protein